MNCSLHLAGITYQIYDEISVILVWLFSGFYVKKIDYSHNKDYLILMFVLHCVCKYISYIFDDYFSRDICVKDIHIDKNGSRFQMHFYHFFRAFVTKRIYVFREIIGHLNIFILKSWCAIYFGLLVKISRVLKNTSLLSLCHRNYTFFTCHHF